MAWFVLAPAGRPAITAAIRSRMPSPEHQVLVDVVRKDPLVITDLLAESGALPLPAGTAYEVAESTFSEVKSIDFHVDLALTAPAGAPPEAANVLLEVQLSVDPEKLFSWPVYVSLFRREHRRDAILVVLTTEQAVADAIGPEIRLSGDGSKLMVHLLGPAELKPGPATTLSRTHPAFAVMVGLAHAGEPDGFPPVKDAVDALEGGFSESTQRVVYDIFLAKAHEAVRQSLERYMDLKGYEWQSDLARKSFAAGKAEGREEGKELGRREILPEMIRSALATRGVELSDEQRASIETCSDEAQLQAWFQRALTAQTAVDLFDA